MSEAWEIVRIVGTDEEAALIAGFLEANDIPTEVESLLFHQEPVTFGRLGEVRIRVPAEHRQEAQRLLETGQEEWKAAAGTTPEGDSPTQGSD